VNRQARKPLLSWLVSIISYALLRLYTGLHLVEGRGELMRHSQMNLEGRSERPKASIQRVRTHSISRLKHPSGREARKARRKKSKLFAVYVVSWSPPMGMKTLGSRATIAEHGSITFVLA
jgi:hypothetical protein